jgi:hypothetical protein
MANRNTDAREKLYEEYEDSFFRLVMHNAAEKEGKLFLEERAKLNDISANSPSNEAAREFERKLTAYRKGKRSQEKKRFSRRFINKAAVFFLLLIVVFSTAMVSVQAFRVQVMNFLINIQPEYTSFQIKDNASGSSGEKLTVNWTNTYLPTYIPSDYEISEISKKDSYQRLTYQNIRNKDLSIIYFEYNSSNSVAIDTENASLVKAMEINGSKGTLVVKDSLVTITWKIDDHMFVVQTQLDADEAIKIAQSVKFVK